VVLSDFFRPIAHPSLLLQPAEHAAAGPLVQRVPEAPIRGVQDDGRARAQVTPSVRVGAYEHVHQAAVELANLRREVTSGIDPLHCHEISTPAVKRRPGSRRRTVDGTGPAVVISVVTGDRERSVGQCGTDAADAVAVIAAVSLRRVLLDDRWPARRVLSRAVRLRSPAPGRHRARPWL